MSWKAIVGIFIVVLTTMASGCLSDLFDSNDNFSGPIKWSVGNPRVYIEHKYTINGTLVEFIQVGDIGFYWNNKYIMPKNLTPYLLINNETREQCEWGYVPFSNSHYIILCQAVYPGNVTRLDVLLVADGVIFANTTVWREENGKTNS